jgi:hypothetical protein
MHFFNDLFEDAPGAGALLFGAGLDAFGVDALLFVGAGCEACAANSHAFEYHIRKFLNDSTSIFYGRERLSLLRIAYGLAELPSSSRIASPGRPPSRRSAFGAKQSPLIADNNGRVRC